MNGSHLFWALLAVAAAVGGMLSMWAGPRLWLHVARRRRFLERALLEDLLKHVLTCGHEGREANIRSAAGHLGLSQRRIFTLVQKIEAAGLVRSAAGRLRLTPEGEKWALQVVRAHRLWETYLDHVAGMPVTELHGPAEREEHRLTASQVDELDAFLGHPRKDPHGDPIPTASGDISGLGGLPLTDWPVGQAAEIAHIEDEPRSVFREISAVGLKPGSVVEVTGRTSEQLTISDGEKEQALAPVAAGNIQVVPASKGRASRKGLRRLCDLKPGEEAEVVLLDSELRGFTRRRLLDLGITPNARVAARLANAFGDPLGFRVRGATIALRREQAAHIWVRQPAGAPAEVA